MDLKRIPELRERISWKDRLIHIDMSYNNILLVLEALNDKELTEAERATVALHRLIEEFEELIHLLQADGNESLELLYFILREYVGLSIGTSDDEDEEEEEIPNTERYYDFTIDSELIYASFMQAYGMELFDMHGKLEWRRFLALMSGLPQDTTFMEVVGYRSMKIPKKEESSEEYIKHVKKMKKKYRLPPIDPELKQKEMDQKMSMIAKKFDRGNKKE